MLAISETRAAYLGWVARNYGLEQCREEIDESDDTRESDRQNLAVQFVAEYVSLLLWAGNAPEALAEAMYTDVRQVCVDELQDLGLELPTSLLDGVLHEQEAHCWRLAEENQRNVLSPEEARTGKVERRTEETTSAFAPLEEDSARTQRRGSEVTSASSAAQCRLFRKRGDVWELAFTGESVHVRHSKGMEYIAHLLRSPNREVHCLALCMAAGGELEAPVLGSSGDVLDDVARKQYRARIEDLEYQLDQAERNNDQGQKEAAQAEMDRLLGELSSGVGMGGRPRQAQDDADRIRKAVAIAIRRAITSIRKEHAALAGHLKLRIKPGTFVMYEDDGIEWEF